MVLDVLCDLIANGEFASEKIVYFLQRFKAAHIFKLQYNKATIRTLLRKSKICPSLPQRKLRHGTMRTAAGTLDQLTILPGTAQTVQASLQQTKTENTRKSPTSCWNCYPPWTTCFVTTPSSPAGTQEAKTKW